MRANLRNTACAAALVIPVLGHAQQVKAATEGYFSNPLFNTLLAVIILLAITIIALGGVLKTIAGSSLIEEKFRRASKNKIKASGVFLILCLISSETQAQQNNVVTDDSIGGLERYVFYVMIMVIALEALVAGIMIRLLHGYLQPEVNELKKIAEEPARENVLLSKLSGAVPVEQEETIMLDHVYDGIRELDNDLPPWWKYGFYLTILIAVIYMVNYHITKTSPLQAEEYVLSVKKAEKEIEEYMKNSSNNVDETTVTLLTAESDLAAGKDLYINNCAACHGRAGEGTVGPNLTDEYWLHAGGVKDIFKTIKYGWPDQGMKSWKEDFSPVQIAQITSFIKSLAGTNPPNGKAKQGELYIDNSIQNDSLKSKTDTIKTLAEIGR